MGTLRHRLVPVAIGALLASASGAASRRTPPPDPGWQTIGSFEGSLGTGFVRRLNNWLFENERDGDLYQDLGNLSVGVGYDYGGVDLDWDNDFERSVISTHDVLAPGDEVTAEDLSRYREVSQVRTRLRLTWDYLPDLVGDLDVGVQVEGGYVLALARSQRLHEMGSGPGRLERGTTAQEFDRFLDEHAIRGSKNPLVLAAGYGGGVIDMLAGALGKQVADTERAVLFFDDYAEPAVLMPDLGLPLKADLFRESDDPHALAVGDSVTYTAFAGVSPLRGFVARKGVSLSFRRFARFLRETTVQKRVRDQVLVRVRRSFSEGNERTPLKYRPEIRWFAFSLGYTFFEFRRDAFDEVVDEVTYRIDLTEPQGWEFFQRLLRQSATVGPIDDPLAAPPEKGVRLVLGSRRQGPVRDGRLRARLFSWARFDRRRVASTHRIETPELELSEAVRRRNRGARRPFGRRRDFQTSLTLTAQSDVDWKDGPRAGLEELSGPAVTVETTIRSRAAVPEDLSRLAEDLERITSWDELGATVGRYRELSPEHTSGLILRLLLSFGPEQIDRLLSVSPSALWRTLAELLLGPEYRETWATPEARFQWRPIDEAHGIPMAGGEHIARRIDRIRKRDRPQRGRGLGLRLDHLDSRTLFIKASRLADSFGKLQHRLAEGCLSCLADLFEGASEVVLLQALLVELSGGVDDGAVGCEVELFTDQLARPLKLGNGVVYTFSHQRRDEVVEQVADLYDAEPRLRAGELLLNLAAAEPGPGPNECLRMRVFSDQLFADDLALEVAMRRAQPGADAPRQEWRLDLGRPATLAPSPFGISRYLYETILPWPKDVFLDEAYTYLFRVVGPNGLPVTEEQELRAELPDAWAEKAPSWCPATPLPPPPRN